MWQNLVSIERASSEIRRWKKTTFLGGVGHGPGTNEFNFGDLPDHRPDPGVQSPKSGFTGLSIMLAFGGGLRSLATSSYL